MCCSLNSKWQLHTSGSSDAVSGLSDSPMTVELDGVASVEGVASVDGARIMAVSDGTAGAYRLSFGSDPVIQRSR